MEETRIEYRVVCSKYGTPGHAEHAYMKEGVEMCKKYADKLDTKYGRTPEAPYRIQSRTISDWIDTEDSDELY